MTTLETMVSTPEIASSIATLSRAGHPREVSSIRLVRDPMYLTGIAADSFVIATMDGYEPNPPAYQLDRILRSAQASDIAGLIMVDRQLKSLPVTSEALANRASISLFAAGEHVDTAALVIALRTEQIGGATSVFSRAAPTLEAIDDAESVGENPDEIVMRTSAALGVPFRMGVPQPHETSAPVWCDGTVDEYVCWPTVAALEGTALRLVGHRVAAAIGQVRERRRREIEGPIVSRAALLSELLQADVDLAGTLVGRARRVLPIDGWHLVVRFEIDHTSIRGGTQDDFGVHRTLEALSQVALKAALSLDDGWHRVMSETAVTLVRMDTAKPGEDLTHRCMQVAREAISKMQEHDIDIVVHCGVGGVAQGFTGLRRSATEARAGSGASRTAGTTGRPFAFHGGRFRSLLVQWYALEGTRDIISRMLKPLESLGRGQEEEAIRTLRAYLDHPGAPAKAAEDLGVHRNTVTYRISRIFELLDMNLDDPEQRLILQLACRARSL